MLEESDPNAVPQEFENFLHFLFSVNTVLIFGAGIYWHKRRNFKPLTARIPLLMYAVLAGVLIQNTLLWTLPYRRERTAALTGTFLLWVSLPLARDPYMWRVFQLFFLYKLTDKYIKREVNGENSSATPDPPEDWYSRHRHLISSESMSKSFIIFHAIFCALSGLAAVLIMYYSGDIVYAFQGGVQFFYAGVALILVVIIRNVQDAFYLKREFMAIAASWTVESVIAFAVRRTGHPSRYSLFAVFCEPIFAIVISFVIPIAMTYSRAFSSSSTGTHSLKSDEESNKEASVDYKSLDAIVTTPVLADAFMNEVRKHFQVQMVFFLQQLISWKASEPELRAGKASLLYQKFIKPESLLDMNIPPELRQDIEEVLLDEDKLLNTSFGPDFFEKIEDYVREKLEYPLKYFKHSPEYAKAVASLLEGDRLNTGFKQVGIA